MEIPPLTSNQYSIVMLLTGHREMSIASLRRDLAPRGLKRFRPPFSRFVGRMLAAGWVAARDVEKTLETGITVRQRWLTATPEGIAAAQTSAPFYEQLRAAGLAR